MKQHFVALLFSLFLLPGLTMAQVTISMESGLAIPGYNDVRVPNGTGQRGTLFSLKEDFQNVDPAAFFRGEIAWLLGDRHTLELTAAPLTLTFGELSLNAVDFAGTTFSGEDVRARYEFNTYRGSYRYRLVSTDRIQLDLGATLLLRDARIALMQGQTEADDTDLGVVPLFSFFLQADPSDKWSVVLKGDALVGPQGRAEDIFAGVLVNLLEKRLRLKAGYRIIEGGADVDQVYNFALIHFADIGLSLRL